VKKSRYKLCETVLLNFPVFCMCVCVCVCVCVCMYVCVDCSFMRCFSNFLTDVRIGEAGQKMLRKADIV
jgi:hypothetical protein